MLHSPYGGCSYFLVFDCPAKQLTADRITFVDERIPEYGTSV